MWDLEGVKKNSTLAISMMENATEYWKLQLGSRRE